MLDDFWVADGGRSLQVSLSLTDRSRTGDPKSPLRNCQKAGRDPLFYLFEHVLGCCACPVAGLHRNHD